MKRLLLAAIVLLSTVVSGARAASVLQPGGTLGVAAGAALPEGVFFNDISSLGNRDNTVAKAEINLTSIVWSTPFSFYRTRLEFLYLAPTYAITNTAQDRFFLNPQLFGAYLAHDFGAGFNGSYFAGVRAAETGSPLFKQSSFEQRGALSYVANGFNLTVDVINGLYTSRTIYANWINVDVTATKKFGKFEIGGVAFGSSDLNSPTGPTVYKRVGQIAAGGLVGYNFGKFALQAMVTRDVTVHNYTGHETRGWLRAIVPLYVAPAAPMEPIRARY